MENSSKEKGDRQDLMTRPYDLKTLGRELSTVPLKWSGASRMWCTLPAKLLQSCPTLCDPMDGSPPAPLSTGFSRQEYWSGLPFPTPGDLPDPGIEPESLSSPTFQADSLPLGHLGSRHQVKRHLDWTPQGMLWGVSRNPRGT